MRKSPKSRAIVHLAGLSFCMVWCARSMAQPPQHGERLAAENTTISVAALSVPSKAREHFQRAKDAAHAQREDVYQREMGKALEIAPDFAQAYLFKANHEDTAGLYQAAIEDAQRAQTIDPGMASAAILIAIGYNSLHRYDDAYLVLANLHGTATETWQAKYEMARSEIGRRNAESALHWSRLALESAPAAFLDAHLLLANALQLAHRWNEASVQMELYLASESLLVRRAPVERALTHTRLLALREEQPDTR